MPPILIVPDIFTLMASRRRDWETYSRVGQCYVPQVVYEGIQFLLRIAAEQTQELVAQEFLSFWRTSGWKLTNAHAAHPALKPAQNATTSQQARMVVAVAQCVYGLSQEQPKSLIVFVSTSLSLVKRIQSLSIMNLCAITSTGLLQWSRTGHPPTIVTEKLQEMQKAAAALEELYAQHLKMSDFDSDMHSSLSDSWLRVPDAPMSSSRLRVPNSSGHSRFRTPGSSGHSRLQTSGSSGHSKLRTSQARADRDTEPYKDKSAPVYTRRTKPMVLTARASRSNFFVSVGYGMVALAAILLAVGIAWRTIHPPSFQQFWYHKIMPVWQQKIAPALPKLLPQ
jgi:hypothetical protein